MRRHFVGDCVEASNAVCSLFRLLRRSPLQNREVMPLSRDAPPRTGGNIIVEGTQTLIAILRLW